MFNSDSTMVSTEGKNSMLVTKELVEKMTRVQPEDQAQGQAQSAAPVPEASYCSTWNIS